MRYVILGLLLARPGSLYDLHKQFSGGISLFYRASYGSLRRAVTGLLAEGWVEEADAEPSGRGRKPYAITGQGRVEWRNWMLGPMTGSDAETEMLARVFLLGRLDGVEDRRRTLGVLRARVTDDLAVLLRSDVAASDARVPADRRDEFAYQRATLAYGIQAHQRALEWIDGLGPADAGEATR